MRSGIAGSAAAAALGVVGMVSPPDAAAGTAVLPVSLAEGSFVGLRSVAPGRFGRTGSEIADVGDVNGDGLSDVAIAEPSADPLDCRDAGAVHVVFGGSPLRRIDVRSAGFRVIGPRQGTRMPPPVFQPDGPPAGAMAGSSVAGAGDINGDGFEFANLGEALAPLGDVNGDGRGDLLVGASQVSGRRPSLRRGGLRGVRARECRTRRAPPAGRARLPHPRPRYRWRCRPSAGGHVGRRDRRRQR